MPYNASVGASFRLAVQDMLCTSNEAAGLRAKAAPFIERLRTKPQVIGIGLLGGLARVGIRHFADCYSDIDITILLTCDLPTELLGLPIQALIAEAQQFLPSWLPNFKFVEPHSGTEFNVHQHLLEYESQAFVVWDNEKLVLLLDEIAVLAAQKFPDWPADVYAYATTCAFTDKQLRTRTAADVRSGQDFDYAVRILDTEWNRINLYLEDLAK